MIVERLENKRKRLIFRSWHRGMKEMDQIMGSFANEFVPSFSEAELDQYEELLRDIRSVALGEIEKDRWSPLEPYSSVRQVNWITFSPTIPWSGETTC